MVATAAQSSPAQSRLRTVRLLALFALAYLAMAEVGHLMTRNGAESVVPFWPPAGLLFAVLVASSPRLWPWLVVVALAAALVPGAIQTGRADATAVASAASDATAAVIGALLLRRALPLPLRIDSIRSVVATAMAALPAAAAGAALVSLAAWLEHGAAFGATWVRWWIASALGMLIVAPLALGALLPGGFEWRVLRARAAEAFVLTVALLASTAYLFFTPAPLPLSYVPLLLLVWSALRFGVVGSALASAAFALIAVYGTVRGTGPIDVGSLTERLALVQSLVGAYAFVSLLMAAMFRQQRLGRHALRAALEQKSTMLQVISDHSQDIVYAKDTRGRLLFANPAIERFFGRPAAELIGLDVYQTVPDAAAARAIDDSDKEVMALGRAMTVEETIQFPDGALTLLSTKVPVSDANGEITGLVGIAHDLTERKRTEDALRDSEQRTRLAMQASRMYAFEWEIATDRVLRSAESLTILGLAPGQEDRLSGQDYLNMVDAVDRPRYSAAIAGLAPGRDTYSLLYRLVRPDGQTITLEETAQAFFDAHGAPMRITGVTVDVSQRERTVDALQLSEEHYAALTAALPALMHTALPDGNCDFVNDTWCQFTGLTREQARGYGWLDVIHRDDHERIWRLRSSAVAADVPFSYQYRMRRADGAWRWVQGRAAPVRDRSGRTVRWVGVSMDVDDQRRAEQALRAADRRKDEFLAMLAHELRNPLAPIRNGVQLLKRSLKDRPQLDSTVAMLDRQMLHLTRLVDDLLDVARITQGRIALQRQSVELRAVLQSAIETARPLIDAQRDELIAELPPPSVRVDADATRLAQVVSNLLNNAAKYSEAGSRIWLSASRTPAGVEIRVRDEGIGIPPELLPQVFDLFTQGERSLDRSRGGLGIGLALVKRLVEMHGGEVAASSDGPGTGAEFVVRLPTEQPADLPAKLPANQAA